jgi:site-specific recombinase XerD
MTKEELLRIEQGMIGCLNNYQMERLHAKLKAELEMVIGEDQGTNDSELVELFISAKRVEGCSEKSLKYYVSTINNLLAGTEKSIKELATDDIRDYLSNYQKDNQVSKVTVDNVRRIFSSFFSWLEDEDYIVKSPVRRIHKVKTTKTVKETYSDEALEIMRDGCTTTRDLAMVDLLASTGMRVGELVNLNRDDIDFENRECVVLGKGDKERKVYFDARAKVHLKKYLEERSDENEALFVSLINPFDRLQISGVEIRLREMGRRLNIPKCHPHKFRRTLATVAIDKGMPVEQVQQLLGHSKIDTTMQYAMVNQENVKNSHRKYLS